MVIEISALTTLANRQKEEIQHQRTKEIIEPKLKLNKEVCLKFKPVLGSFLAAKDRV
jgi:hypothetical protein